MCLLEPHLCHTVQPLQLELLLRGKVLAEKKEVEKRMSVTAKIFNFKRANHTPKPAPQRVYL